MDSVTAEYKRLRGLVNDFLLVGNEHHSLWLAEDHLLCVRRDGYAETYKRFYFRDIKALVMHKTRRHVFLSSALGIVLGCFGALLLAAFHYGWGGGAKFVFGVTSSIFAFMLALNLSRGGSCVCCLETAVQKQVLYPLSRLCVAERALVVLRERIEAVQGRLPAGVLESWVATRGPTVEFVPLPASAPVSHVPKHCTGIAHLFFFSFLIADFVLTLVTFFTEEDRLPDSVGIGFIMGLAISAVFALVSQERSDLWVSVRRLAWAGLVYLAGTLVAGVVAAIALGVWHGVNSPDQIEKYLMPTASMEGFVLGVISLLASGFIGGIGLRRTLQYRRQSKARRGPPVPPARPLPTSDPSAGALPSPDEVSA